MAYANGNNKKMKKMIHDDMGNPTGLNGDMSALGGTTEYGIETPLSDLVRTGPPVQPMGGIQEPMGGMKPAKTSVRRRIAQGEERTLDDLVPVGNGLNGDVSALGFTSGVSGIEPMSEPQQTISKKYYDEQLERMRHARNRRGGDYGERSGRSTHLPWFVGAGPGAIRSGPRRRRTTTGQVSSEYGNQNW